MTRHSSEDTQRMEREALPESEERLRIVADFTYDWEYWRSPANRFLYVSPSCKRITGYAREEFLRDADLYLRIVHPDDRARVADHLREDLNSSHAFEIEFRIVHRDGQERWIGHVCRAVLDASGQRMGRRASNRDITDRKRTEQALRQLNARLEQRVAEQVAEIGTGYETVKMERQRLYDVLETLPAYVVLLSEDCHVHFANKFFRERFGESGGKRCFEYLFHRTAPCENCESFKALKTRAPHRWEWTGPDGRNYDIHDYPFSDADGSPMILEMGIDITARKKAEAALRTAGAYNRSLIEASPDPLVTIGPDGKITDVNAATESVTGRRRDELVGTDFSTCFTDAEKARAGYEQVFREGFVRDYALEIRSRDGRVTPVLYNASVYRDEAGQVIGVFAAARDITERRRMEAETRRYQQRLQELAERLAAAEEEDRWRISRYIHDTIVQNLSLSSIRLGSMEQPLRDAHLTEEADKLRQVRALLDQAIEECRMVMSDLTPALLYELGLIPALHDLARQLEATHGTRIVIEDDGQEKPLPHPLRGLLFESVRELIMNAVKHAGPCEIRVTAGCREGALAIRVVDNGKGFDPSGAVVHPDRQGGFGLFNVRQRVEGMGGRLDIASAPGQGTSATIRMPAGSGGTEPPATFSGARGFGPSCSRLSPMGTSRGISECRSCHEVDI